MPFTNKETDKRTAMKTLPSPTSSGGNKCKVSDITVTIHKKCSEKSSDRVWRLQPRAYALLTRSLRLYSLHTTLDTPRSHQQLNIISPTLTKSHHTT